MTMRPQYFTFTPADETTDGIAAALTGVGPWDSGDFTIDGPSDGLAHQLSLTSAANLSAITITITGTDADDQEVTEARAGPNANTVETATYFKTVTSISAGATLGANTMDVGWVDEFVSQTIPLESYLHNETVNCQVDLTGTATYDLETTMSDLRASYSPPPSQDDYLWLNDANFTNKNASLQAKLATVARAVRLAVNSYSSGASIELAIITPQ